MTEPPFFTIEAHVAASRPTEREPSTLGEQYLPPVHSGMKKYCEFRSSLERNSTTELPLSA